jgi:hypothetical protein
MLGRPASEKRRGTKSREVGAPSVPRALWGFGPRHQVGRGYIKAPPVAFRAGWVWVTAGTNTAGVARQGRRCDCGPICQLAVSEGCAGREPAGMASLTGLVDQW